VIMTHDNTAKRHGYTNWSYREALDEGLLPQHRPGERFMQDNVFIYNAWETRSTLRVMVFGALICHLIHQTSTPLDTCGGPSKGSSISFALSLIIWETLQKSEWSLKLG
jgi:hypothetical protein